MSRELIAAVQDSLVEGSKPLALRSRWVVPVSQPPLRDAAVTIAGGRIVAVGPAPRDIPLIDLGDVAILPSLINAHTHLEFSDLAQPIGTRGMSLVDWLRAVIESRSAARAVSRSPIEMGMEESIRCGVMMVGEIGQGGTRKNETLAPRCDGIDFLELIAPTADRVDLAAAKAKQHLAVATSTSWRRGLSPHAPYTVHPELLARAVALSVEYSAPLAMHLAESQDEIEFLRDSSGPFRELLEARGAWEPASRSPGGRPLDEMRMLSRSHRALVVHGNYLDAEEIEVLGQHNDNMSVVYCPRTHAWFDHARYPLEAMLAAGARVAIGTDSRASSPDLNLLAELRHVAKTFPGVARAQIMQFGTINGAAALDVDQEIGTLEPGKRANMIAIAIGDDRTADPCEVILNGNAGVVQRWYQGIVVASEKVTMNQ